MAGKARDKYGLKCRFARGNPRIWRTSGAPAPNTEGISWSSPGKNKHSFPGKQVRLRSWPNGREKASIPFCLPRLGFWSPSSSLLEKGLSAKQMNRSCFLREAWTGALGQLKNSTRLQLPRRKELLKEIQPVFWAMFRKPWAGCKYLPRMGFFSS